MEEREDRLLEDVRGYWSARSDTYSEQNVEEMNDERHEIWRRLLLMHAPEKEALRVLDVGTGPGFFAMNLAQAGHQVTAVDVTREMLEHAARNAQAYGVSVELLQYDGHRLPLEDESFDLVVSRNVLWTVEDPMETLSEWKRVLAPGGRIVYFDANYYLHLFDEEQRARSEEAHRQYHQRWPEKVHDILGHQKAQFLEELARSLPLSREHRPEWDLQALRKLDLRLVRMLPNVGEQVWDESERVHYAATPLFMICAQKE